jgi:hypothetical protein
MSGDEVTARDEAIRRALQALGADEAVHPGHEVLEAYVEGALSADEAAAIDRLAARSAIVAEDIADLRSIQADLARQPVGRRDIRWSRAAAVAAAVAASLVAAIWMTNRPAPAPVQPPAALTQMTATEAARVRRVIDEGRVELSPAIQALITREGTLLSEPGQAVALRPVSPLGTAVRSSRPLFTWADSGADAYTIAVFDEGFGEVARSARVSGLSWSPDADLPRGATYVWQVTAHRGSQSETEPKPPRPEARFSVIDAAMLARVENMQARLSGEPLALGILLAEAGLIADARVELTRAAQSADSAAVAQRLLAALDQGTPITTKPAQ